MKVIFLTEIGFKIGFGHITRCKAIYQAFEEKGITPEFIVNSDETTEELLKDTNHKVFNWLKESERLFNLLKQSDVVVIDSYLADYEFCKQISELVKLPVYIDDYKRINYPRGIVINRTIFAEKMNYPEEEGLTYLLGSQYVPLDKTFWNVPEKEIKDHIKTLMITFGGADIENLTPKVLGFLMEHHPLLIKNVVIGKGYQNVEEIKKAADSKVNLVYYPNLAEMQELMFQSDIAISGGGQTISELARVGTPTVVITIADNQKNNVKGWQKVDFIEYAGSWDDNYLSDNLNKCISNLKDPGLRKKKSKIGRETINGLGALRIVKHIVKKYFENNIILRKTEFRDIYNTYELSNDNEVRTNSFSQEKIELNQHKNWFAKKINDPLCVFLVVEFNSEFLGQIRFDIDKEQAIISVSIKNLYRRLGIGDLAVGKALSYLKAKCPDIKFVKAFVKEGNIASKRFFENLNFLYENSKKIRNQNAQEYSINL